MTAKVWRETPNGRDGTAPALVLYSVTCDRCGLVGKGLPFTSALLVETDHQGCDV